MLLTKNIGMLTTTVHKTLSIRITSKANQDLVEFWNSKKIEILFELTKVVFVGVKDRGEITYESPIPKTCVCSIY